MESLYEVYPWAAPRSLTILELPTRDTVALDSSCGLLWSTWSKDPIKAAVLGAMVSVQVRLKCGWPFLNSISGALTQQPVCFFHSDSLSGGVHY